MPGMTPEAVRIQWQLVDSNFVRRDINSVQLTLPCGRVHRKQYVKATWQVQKRSSVGTLAKQVRRRVRQTCSSSSRMPCSVSRSLSRTIAAASARMRLSSTVGTDRFFCCPPEPPCDAADAASADACQATTCLAQQPHADLNPRRAVTPRHACTMTDRGPSRAFGGVRPVQQAGTLDMLGGINRRAIIADIQHTDRTQQVGL